MNSTQMVLTEEKADLYDAALDHVNDVLNELEMTPVNELEKGVPTKAFACPISNTIMKALEDLDYGCGSYRFTTVYSVPVRDENGTGILDGNFEIVYRGEMSDLSHEFQRAFDRGEFPELIAE